MSLEKNVDFSLTKEIAHNDRLNLAEVFVDCRHRNAELGGYFLRADLFRVGKKTVPDRVGGHLPLPGGKAGQCRAKSLEGVLGVCDNEHLEFPDLRLDGVEKACEVVLPRYDGERDRLLVDGNGGDDRPVFRHEQGPKPRVVALFHHAQDLVA